MRSSWKPISISKSILKKINYLNSLEDKASFIPKIYDRSSVILPDFVGLTVQIHNVKLFIHYKFRLKILVINLGNILILESCLFSSVVSRKKKNLKSK